MIDPAWTPGVRIAGTASDGSRQTGTLREVGVLAGHRVAYVEWDAPRPRALYAETGRSWVDTVLLASIAVREMAA